jgi:hypothetical protein
VKVVELVSYELQAPETNDLVWIEVGHVSESTGAVDGELEAAKADGVPEDLGRRVDAGSRHRTITWQ